MPSPLSHPCPILELPSNIWRQPTLKHHLISMCITKPLLFQHLVFQNITQGSLSSCISELSLAVVGEPAVVGELGDERTFALEMQARHPGTRKKREGSWTTKTEKESYSLDLDVFINSWSNTILLHNESVLLQISTHRIIPYVYPCNCVYALQGDCWQFCWGTVLDMRQSQRLIKLERSHWVPKMGCRHDNHATSNRTRYSKINNPEDTTRCQQNVTYQDTTNLNKHDTTKCKKHEQQ